MQRTSRGAWGVTVTQLAVPRAAPSSAALGSHLLGNVGNVENVENVGNAVNNDMEVQSLQSFYAILCPHVKNVLSWLPRLSRLSHYVPLLTLWHFMAACSCHQRGSLWWILGLQIMQDRGSEEGIASLAEMWTMRNMGRHTADTQQTLKDIVFICIP